VTSMIDCKLAEGSGSGVQLNDDWYSPDPTWDAAYTGLVFASPYPQSRSSMCRRTCGSTPTISSGITRRR
jgi:hypothetical protein